MRATVACAVVFGGLALVAASPVPKVDDKPPPITDKHISDSQENLKQFGIGFHNHNDATGALPTDILDKDGKALLSWRVRLLPYIEQEELYKQFKLNEPWDGPNNKKLIEKMPKIYAPIRVKAKAGETFYQVFAGKDALFGPKKTPQIPASIPDGTSCTAMVVEGGEPVVWTRPADLPFDEKKPLPKLGGLFDGSFNVVLCDGSVMRIKKPADPTQLKRFIMPADGNVIDLDQLTNPKS